MTLWLRSRRWSGLTATLVLMLGLGTLAGQRAVLLPTVIGTGTNGTLLAAFLPLAWAAAIADAFVARTQAVEARPTRSRWRFSRLGILDVSLFLGATALVASTYAVVVVTTGTALAGVGPLLILSGLACCGTLTGGPARGVFATSVLLVVTTVYGAGAPAARYVRVLQSDGDPTWSALCGVLVCLVASWCLLTGQVTTRLGRTEDLC